MHGVVRNVKLSTDFQNAFLLSTWSFVNGSSEEKEREQRMRKYRFMVMSFVESDIASISRTAAIEIANSARIIVI